MERIDEYIKQAKSLPPAPRILPQLMEMLSKEDVDSGNVVHLITFDPSLTAKVLQVCNSAAYAVAQAVADVNEAVARLGFGAVYKIVARVISEQTLAPAQAGYGIGKGELAEHCAITAVAAQIIAEDLQLDAQTAFTAGLLHDVGKIVLAATLEASYADLIKETEVQARSLLEAERSLLGVDHAQIGGRLLQQWKFPEALVEAVTWHHDPAGAPEHHRPLAACVYVANIIAALTGHSYGYQALALHGRADALQILKVKGDSMPLYMIRTIEQARKSAILKAA